MRVIEVYRFSPPHTLPRHYLATALTYIRRWPNMPSH
jgi:hypothetical protein